MNKKLFSFVSIMVFAIMPFLVHGATIKADRNYYLAPGEIVNDNLYSAGYNTNIGGEVYGDLIACGANVTVSGYVDGDIASAGGTLNIMASVLGDERVAGGNITISNIIGGDLIAAGGQISIMPNASIGKDAKIAGGTVNYGGSTNGDLEIMGDQIYINGIVNGDLKVSGNDIELGPQAKIGGNFTYSSPNEATMATGVMIGGLTSFDKTSLPIKKEMPAGLIFGFISMGLFMKAIIVAVAALILIYFFRKRTEIVIKESVSSFWRKAGMGFILLLVIPAAAMLSFASVIGAILGMVIMSACALLMAIASVVAPLLFAKLSLKYVFKKENYMINWWIVILSVFVLGIISLIPFIGWLFGFIIFLASLGATADYFYKKLKD